MLIAEAIALAHSRRAGGAAPSDSTLTCAQAVRLFVRQYIEREWKQTKNAKQTFVSAGKSLLRAWGLED